MLRALSSHYFELQFNSSPNFFLLPHRVLSGEENQQSVQLLKRSELSSCRSNLYWFSPLKHILEDLIQQQQKNK